MGKIVFTGWRHITPGKCFNCGESEDWECDGRGTVYCSCQTCPECGEFDGHSYACSDESNQEEG